VHQRKVEKKNLDIFKEVNGEADGAIDEYADILLLTGKQDGYPYCVLGCRTPLGKHTYV
jgi:hypothetical protein